MNQQIKIQMFGEFSFSTDSNCLSDRENRSGKVWMLLAYMICFRDKPISDEELINALWHDGESNLNPVNALKTMFHRCRALLDQVYDGCGRDLIIRRKGTYAFNTEAAFILDTEEFEQLHKAAANSTTTSEKLSNYLQAIDVYQGEFLPKLNSEIWAVPLKSYYQNMYLQIVHESIAILRENKRYEEAVQVCRKAIAIERFDERLYYCLMRSLLDLGRNNEAGSVFKEMSDLLYSSFGVMPSDQMRALNREATRTVNTQESDLSAIKSRLQEHGQLEGAYFCEYDFFKALYQAEARMVSRNGYPVHVGLITVTDENEQPLPARSLNHCMENLADIVRLCLRKGDVVSKYSSSQYLILLPHANYENSHKIFSRIIRSFKRQYPHSPAVLGFSVQALDPIV